MSPYVRTAVLVGDRFAGFAVQDGVFTVSLLLDDLRSGAYGADGPAVRFVCGQGVTETDRLLVEEEIRRLGLEHRLGCASPSSTLSSRGEVHKHDEDNALITGLHRLGDRLFGAGLRIHNDNELLVDHQTGQHVQGMVAVEAARQMFLAVTERFYACRWPERRYYFVIESLHTDFENFLFPLPATVDYLVTSEDTENPARLSFTAEVGIHQGGRRCAVSRVAFTAFESRAIEAKEDRRAAKAVAYTLAASGTSPDTALAGV